ncbi:hypothetical protein QQ045_032630 [Rhodiola kirilowii]
MVCRPKGEGGLGIKDLKTFNNALVMKQLWDLQENKQNLWVEWLKAYWTKGRDWWLDTVDSSSSWIMQRLSALRDTYDRLREHGSEVDWASLVWNSFNAPRDSVNAWLACHDRLMTKDRIRRMGGNIDPSCVLCGNAEESRDHLFFTCPIAAELWNEGLKYVGVNNGPSQWHLLIPWFKRRRQGTLQTRFIAAAATRTMYTIWSLRNKKLFENVEVDVTASRREIIGGLRMKLGAIVCRNPSELDRQWLTKVGMLP